MASEWLEYTDIIHCSHCSVGFTVPVVFDKRRRANGAEFYCPNGHVLSYKKHIASVAQQRIAGLEARLRDAEEREEAEEARRQQCPQCPARVVLLQQHQRRQHGRMVAS